MSTADTPATTPNQNAHPQHPPLPPLSAPAAVPPSGATTTAVNVVVSEYGIPLLASLPLVEGVPRRKRLTEVLAFPFQRIRQMFHLKGEGLYKEEDSKTINTLLFVVITALLLAALTYAVVAAFASTRTQRPKPAAARHGMSVGLPAGG